MLDIIILIILFLLAASYFDLRTGEVPDGISFGLALILLLIGVAGSIYQQKLLLLDALIAAGAYFIISYFMYYICQWGGADVKILTGVGLGVGLIAAQTINPTGLILDHPAVAYMFDIMFVITPYAAAYTLILGILNRDDVFPEFKRSIRDRIFLSIFFFSTIPLIILLLFPLNTSTNKFLIIIAALLPAVALLSQYLRVIEGTVLRKTIAIGELKEWDMISEDIIVDGEKIASKRNADGLGMDEIKRIQDLAHNNKIPDMITIKQGIPFIPVFLLAFLLFLKAGNVLSFLVLFLI